MYLVLILLQVDMVATTTEVEKEEGTMDGQVRETSVMHPLNEIIRRSVSRNLSFRAKGVQASTNILPSFDAPDKQVDTGTVMANLV